WLTERGPQFLRTTDFFRVEQKEYTLELDAMQESKYSVSVSVSVDRVWINTVSWYNTTGIQPNEDFYTLHLDAYYDEAQNIGGEDRTLRNYTYRIELPPGYELYSNSSINTDVIGFTDILIDPMRGSGVGTVTLTANRSWEGTAHAEVTCPKEGENELYFHLVNDDPKNYSVVVPAEVEVCFSAEKSEDPNGPSGKISPYANFTWDFGDGTKGYGINPTHNYSDPGTAEANYTVRLDILEPGHNETNISINVKVDARAPVAKVWFDPEVYADQHIKEDVSFRFSANLSTDEMYDGQEGNITKWYWDHDSDGNWDEYTEEVETDFFTEPGKYWFNLTVEDWVGHKSENYSILLIVDDVTPPDASFFVLNDTYVKVDSVYENKTMYFNASDTVDNFSTQENLTFTWSIGGENKTGVNVSYIFEEAGEYDINLTVSDDEGNEGYYNITLPVLINPAIHANLKVVPDSLNFTPESPEEGTPVKISVEITNDEDSSEAVGVQVVFSIINEHTTKIGATVRFYDEEGNATTNTIPPGGRIKAEITWTPGTHGKYMIQVNCSAENEPPEHIHDDNKAKEELTVREAGWVTPLIIAVLIVLIFIIAIILLVRRKFAGRLPSIRKRKRLEEKRKKKVKK
ncbi:MAG: PKD domain-containing protein, partial [Thermoplasmata archaeon]